MVTPQLVHATGKAVQVLEVSHDENYVALVCSSELRVIKLDTVVYEDPVASSYYDRNSYGDAMTISNHNNSNSNSYGNSNNNNNSHLCTGSFYIPNNTTITDVAWAPKDSKRLVISMSNGGVVFISLIETSGRKNLALKKDWMMSNISNCVNRISWHPTENNVLVTANKDGTTKILDCRYKINPCKVYSYGDTSVVATRDAQFDPFHSNFMADVSDSGTLRVWDRKEKSKPIMSKTMAHDTAMLTQINVISYSPHHEWMIATGGKDRIIKLWDLDSCSIDKVVLNSVGLTIGNSTTNLLSSGLAFTINSHDEIEPLLVQTITTSASVNKIVWREMVSTHSSKDYLASSSNHESGAINLWDGISKNIPVCCIKGSSPCAGFQFLYKIKLVSSNSNCTNTFTNDSANSSSTTTRYNSSSNIADTLKSSLSFTDSTHSASFNLTTSTSFMGNSNHSSKSTNDAVSVRDISKETESLYTLYASGSSDGKLYLFNLKYAHFPTDHMASTVTALSSQGHVAFSKNFINRVSTIINNITTL